MTIKFYVEGIADIKFLSDYIRFQYNVSLGNDDIIETGGWTKILSDGEGGEMITNKMMQNSDNDGLNLLIFDADSDFNQRVRELEKWKLDTHTKL